MAAEGAVRWTPNGADWATAGFLLKVMPNRASLSSLIDHEDGQFVYLVDDGVLVTWSSVTGWTDISGAPPVPVFRMSNGYRPGDLVIDQSDGLIYRSPVNVVPNGRLPSDPKSPWEAISGGAGLLIQDSTVAIPAGSQGQPYLNPDLRAIGTIDTNAQTGALLYGEILSEHMIRQWIAASSNFRGTVQDDGSTIQGATEVSNVPAATANNTGQYFISVESFDWTNAAGTVVHVDPGDWMLSTGADYVIVPGGQMTKDAADQLYAPIDARPKVLTTAVAGQDPTTVPPNAALVDVPVTWQYGVVLDASPRDPAAGEAVTDQLGTWKFHITDTNADDWSAALQAIQPGDAIRATGPDEATGAMDQVMRLEVQSVTLTADIATVVGTVTDVATPAAQAGDPGFMSGTACEFVVETLPSLGFNAKEDDVIINTADSVVWIYGGDGTSLDWVKLPTVEPQIVVAGNTGETPQLPGSAAMPTTLRPGAIFVNEVDGDTWVYHDDSTGKKSVWSPIGGGGSAGLFYGRTDPPNANVDDYWLVSGSIVGVIEGAPGQFLPASQLPFTLADIQALGSLGQVAAWHSGSFLILGDGSAASWDGNGWVAGTVVVPVATTVTAGAPGSFGPAGHRDPTDKAELDAISGGAVWGTVGDYVLVGGTNYWWDGSAWQVGQVPVPALVTSATAGSPGSFVPQGNRLPVTKAELDLVTGGAAWSTPGNFITIGPLPTDEYYWGGAAWVQGRVPGVATGDQQLTTTPVAAPTPPPITGNLPTEVQFTVYPGNAVTLRWNMVSKPTNAIVIVMQSATGAMLWRTAVSGTQTDITTTMPAASVMHPGDFIFLEYDYADGTSATLRAEVG